jgi:hypothetical protein
MLKFPQEMFIMKRSLTMIAALGLLASLAGVTPSHAASVTYTSNTISETPVPFTSSVLIQKFDTSLGTLTGISFTIVADITATVKVVNLATTSETFTNAFTSDTVTTTGPGGFTLSTTPTASVASGTVAAGALNTYPGTTGTSTGSSVYTGSFTPYEGPGSATVALGFAGGSASSGGTSPSSDILFGGSAAAGGYVKVTYTYTPSAVPEPTSMALLGIGMTSFLAFRRFFKRTPVA